MIKRYTNLQILCLEEENFLRTVVFNCRHGYTQEEYDMKRERLQTEPRPVLI